jgi:protein-S-isoprenylcysteine O-methyltransferase Ste14
MPIITQLIVTLIVTLIAYLHFKYSKRYRSKYGDLAYQYYFFHFILPYLITWYALFFHPLFIQGSPLLPFEVSFIIGLLFLVLFILVSIHIERAGFKTITHGMDIYTIFPEEATIVRGEIYGYIRHPLYLSLTCGCFAMAFFANNFVSFIVAILQLIPCFVVGKLEDNELINRTGKEHKKYIQETSLLFPLKTPIKFLKLLLFI